MSGLLANRPFVDRTTVALRSPGVVQARRDADRAEANRDVRGWIRAMRRWLEFRQFGLVEFGGSGEKVITSNIRPVEEIYVGVDFYVALSVHVGRLEDVLGSSLCSGSGRLLFRRIPIVMEFDRHWEPLAEKYGAEEAGFLNVIEKFPEDETPLNAYADWLESQGVYHADRA